MTVLPTPPRHITIGVLALQGAFIEHIHYLQRLRFDNVTLEAIAVRTADGLAVGVTTIRTALWTTRPLALLTAPAACDALIIPGGESTVISRVASATPGLLDALQAFARDPERAVWGTCAGMILMADEIGGGKVRPGSASLDDKGVVRGWAGIPGLRVWRNLYGESFEYPLVIPCLQDARPFNTIFIRAPAVHSVAAEVSVAEPSKLAVHISAGPRSTAEPDFEVLASLPQDLHPPHPPADTSLGSPDPDLLGAVMLRARRKLVTSFHPELSGDARIHGWWIENCVLA